MQEAVNGKTEHARVMTQDCRLEGLPSRGWTQYHLPYVLTAIISSIKLCSHVWAGATDSGLGGAAGCGPGSIRGERPPRAPAGSAAAGRGARGVVGDGGRRGGLPPDVAARQCSHIRNELRVLFYMIMLAGQVLSYGYQCRLSV